MGKLKERTLKLPLRGNWFDWREPVHRFLEGIEEDSVLPAFEAHVVTYRSKELMPQQGLHRRHALRVLRNLGLRAPSAIEVFRLAAEEELSNPDVGPMKMTIVKEQGRCIVCPTPINLEFPDFYRFGSGTFKVRRYHRIAGIDDLFFGLHGLDGKMQGGLQAIYNYPLILGVKE